MFGADPDELMYEIVEHYPGRVQGNLWVLGEDDRQWVYEVCNTKYDRSKMIRSHLLKSYLFTNKKQDQHCSVFAHDQAWVQAVKETGKGKLRDSQVRVDSLWIELDRKIDGGFERAVYDAMEIRNNFPFPEHVCIWTSGNESTHIEINGALFGFPTGHKKDYCGRGGWVYNLALRICGKVRNGVVLDPWTHEDDEELKGIYTQLTGNKPHPKYKQELENMDPNIYGFNSLIRAKWSIHETGGGQKIPFIGDPEFPDVSAYLAHWFIEECKPKKTKKKYVDIDVESSYIIKEFSDIPGFDPDECDEYGWSCKLYNPFYEDTNPGLAVNIENGMFWDFGDPDYQFDFTTYLMKKYNLDEQEALKLMKQ
jgi:hypothetical protein